MGSRKILFSFSFHYFLLNIPPSAGPAAAITQMTEKLIPNAVTLCLSEKQPMMATHTEQPVAPSANPQTTKYKMK